jgi:hypothetical protein
MRAPEAWSDQGRPRGQGDDGMSAPLTICYRAEFEGPTGLLNPSGWKVPGKIGVEIRKSGARWVAFRPGTKSQFNEIAAQFDAQTIKNQVGLYFKKQASEWQMYELSEPSGKAILLKPEEAYSDAKGRIYRK